MNCSTHVRTHSNHDAKQCHKSDVKQHTTGRDWLSRGWEEGGRFTSAHTRGKTLADVVCMQRRYSAESRMHDRDLWSTRAWQNAMGAAGLRSTGLRGMQPRQHTTLCQDTVTHNSNTTAAVQHGRPIF